MNERGAGSRPVRESYAIGGAANAGTGSDAAARERVGPVQLPADAGGGLPAVADRRPHPAGGAAPDRRHRARRGRPLSRALGVGRHRHLRRSPREGRRRREGGPRGRVRLGGGEGNRARNRPRSRRAAAHPRVRGLARSALPPAARGRRRRRRPRDQARLLQALAGVPSRPALRSRARQLRCATRSDLPEARRGLRAVLGPDDPRRDRPLARTGAAAGGEARSGGRGRGGGGGAPPAPPRGGRPARRRPR
jgi:hypothetical protein